jgi:hypothetical protein
VTGLDEFVVVGSQAILGSLEQPPESMLQSLEVDIYPLRDPRATDLIDGALGDGSQFHVAFGYCPHGVGPETAKAPAGWQERLVKRDVPSRPGSEGTIVARTRSTGPGSPSGETTSASRHRASGALPSVR